MKPFRERNPLPIGVIGIVATLALVGVAFDVQNLPPFRGTTYKAQFTEAGDLLAGDEVRIAGIRVGEVKKLKLDGSQVEVDFTVKGDGVQLGTATRAVIKLKTLVGSRYLEIDPDGPGTMNPKTPIPVTRTVSPFSINDAFNGLSNRASSIDAKQLSQSFEVLSSAFANTPGLNKQALVGLSRLSHTVASRDTQLQSLLSHTQQVVGTLNESDANLHILITQAASLLEDVQRRRTVIDQLLVDTSTLAQQLGGLAQDNTAVLNSALGHVNSVFQVLENDRTQLDQTIQLLGPYTRLFSDTIGNGRWFDTVIYNLVPNLSPTAIVQSIAGATVTPGSVPGGSSTGAGGGATGGVVGGLTSGVTQGATK